NTKTTGAVAQYARIRVRQQRARWWSALLFLRLALLTVAVAVVVVGGVRYVSRAERAGALEFTPHDIGLSGSAVGVQAVEIHDIDGDGDQDIITTGLEGVKIYQNKGDLAFTITLVDTLPAERVQAVDLNADGRADLLVTYKGGQPSVQWYENLGELKFRPHSLSGAGVNVVAYAGDINADGSPDVVTAGRTSEGIVLKRWMNNGSGKLASSLLASASGVTAISIGDLDQDGYNDVVVGGNQGLTRWDTSDGTVWDQIVIDASQTDQTHIAVASSSVSRSYVAAAHGLNDEVYLYLSGPDAASYANYGRVLVASGIDAKTVVVTDVEGDGDIDVLVAAQDDQAVFWFENDGGTGFTEHRLISDVLNVYGVAAADVTGDLVVDVVTADHVRGTVILLEQVASLTDEDALGLVLPASDETQAEAEPQRNPADRAGPLPDREHRECSPVVTARSELAVGVRR
ncbi:VCBS repeat-containing protein, partial [Patescibacteria group bacterium]|nr:VCBS repeat-containing protein [Patescibacteria group bacterium]